MRKSSIYLFDEVTFELEFDLEREKMNFLYIGW